MADPVLAFQDHAKLVEVRCFRLCHRSYARKEREREREGSQSPRRKSRKINETERTQYKKRAAIVHCLRT